MRDVVVQDEYWILYTHTHAQGPFHSLRSVVHAGRPTSAAGIVTAVPHCNTAAGRSRAAHVGWQQSAQWASPLPRTPASLGSATLMRPKVEKLLAAYLESLRPGTSFGCGAAQDPAIGLLIFEESSLNQAGLVIFFND